MIMAYTKDEYYAALDKAVKLKMELLKVTANNAALEEEIEILKDERTHWYHMYNQESSSEHS